LNVAASKLLTESKLCVLKRVCQEFDKYAKKPFAGNSKGGRFVIMAANE
jgi:hypothetical protein